MKTNITCLFISLTILALGLMSNAAGRGGAAGEQRAGAPGENATTCSQCHNSGDFGTSVSITLTDVDGNIVPEYIPNESYLVNLSINSSAGNPTGYGFQMVALDKEDNPVNAWGSNIDPSLRVIDLLGRDYVEQTETLAESSWSIPWVGPATGTDAVTFYACGNNVDGSGNTSGDEAATTSFTIPEGLGASSEDLSVNLPVAYPNPVSDVLRISNAEKVHEIQIFSAQGNMLVKSQNTDQNFYMNDLDSGTYLIMFYNASGKRLKVQRIIKI